MNAADIGLTGLAASSILIAVGVAISMWRHLGLEGQLLWAALRALVQLLIVGFALQLVIDNENSLVYSLIWLAVMQLFASYTTWRRAPEVPSVFLLALIAYSASMIVTLGVLFGFQVYEFEGRTIVPLAGIVVGNSLSATVLLSRRIFDAGRERRTEIEGRLALGLSAVDAFQPVLRNSLRTALIPQIESTKAVGIIALPGAMVGLILAGVDPADAVRVQISVMYLVLGSVATTTAVMSLGISRKMFTSSDQLIRRS
ncbi:MAG: iron export ABC transporter permease subunit FetB [Ilumatobacter sp.]|nr:iron export ABC transporter permease subunit FetB [bacterium]MDG1267474.1 iron export ABC transporter permease subunit FetB [Ilumatobacter sp.]MDG2039698.1 iron export ABC transporter permease subunit FetB [Ilumatobacter sp.]NKB41083.1 iron export ABC transporter permease subunit FetB [Ilumatobacter sp.]